MNGYADRLRAGGVVAIAMVELTSLFVFIPGSGMLFAAIGVGGLASLLSAMWAWAGSGFTRAELRLDRLWFAVVGVGAPLFALVLAGGGLTGENPDIRDGVKVATVHGEVVRRLTDAQYDALQMQSLRMACVVGTTLIAGGLVLSISVRRAGATAARA
jgi:hypothetical protein